MDDVAPENTLTAFSRAFQAGMGVELDVRSTRDGHLVVLHDETVDRTTNGAGRVGQLTLDEIRALDAGSWKGGEFAGAKVPTLEEVLDLARAEAKAESALFLDVKELPPGIVSKICGALAERDLLGRTVGIGIVIQSIDVRRRFYEGSKDFQCAALCQAPESLASVTAEPYSKWVYARFIPNPAQIASVHAAGKRVFVAGDEVSYDVNAAHRAYNQGPDVLLAWKPTELSALIAG
jgi:glycerophosphoryl diester phosphodiesterase